MVELYQRIDDLQRRLRVATEARRVAEEERNRMAQQRNETLLREGPSLAAAVNALTAAIEKLIQLNSASITTEPRVVYYPPGEWPAPLQPSLPFIVTSKPSENT